jgi:hypothetical protein
MKLELMLDIILTISKQIELEKHKKSPKISVDFQAF